MKQDRLVQLSQIVILRLLKVDLHKLDLTQQQGLLEVLVLLRDIRLRRIDRSRLDHNRLDRGKQIRLSLDQILSQRDLLLDLFRARRLNRLTIGQHSSLDRTTLDLQQDLLRNKLGQLQRRNLDNKVGHHIITADLRTPLREVREEVAEERVVLQEEQRDHQEDKKERL